MNDMASLVNDAMQAMQMLARAGEDVTTLKQEVALLKARMTNSFGYNRQ
jgi:hypothetical protein